MSKFPRLALAGALAAFSCVGFAADDFANIAVTATVQGVCKLTSATVLNIAADPSTGLAAENTAPVSFKCTKNHPYTFSVSQGATSSSTGSLGGTLSDGAATPVTIPFTATWTAPSGTGNGFSTAVTADVKVSIAATAYQDKPAGAYNATLKVNINY
jgi:spore coat protein U-like protein